MLEVPEHCRRNSVLDSHKPDTLNNPAPFDELEGSSGIGPLT
jgi:hypothetical protein